MNDLPREKNAKSGPSASVCNLDRRFAGAAREEAADLERAYRAILAQAVDLLETDIPSLLGPLLHDPAGIPAAAAPFLWCPERR